MQRVSVLEAAQILGVTQQAIRARIKRETIKHEIGEDGRHYVWIEDNEEPNNVDNKVVNAYIATLKSEIEDWKEEARRKDTIIAQMNQTLQTTISRIPELEAPSTEQDDSDTSRQGPPKAPESSVSPTSEAGRGVILPSPHKRSWWRRIFE